MAKSALSIVQKYYPAVLKLADANRSFDVRVTARDCKSGNSNAPDDCAMAVACKREYDGAIISKAIAYLIKGDTAYRYRVPSSVRTEIVSFDRNHGFQPGDYYLKAPQPTERLIALKKWRKSGKGGKMAAVASPRSTVRRNHIPSGVRSL